ncbi:MAG TPA: hypothetical protein VGJ73_21205 [Verrucomicrobiae bacterium]
MKIGKIFSMGRVLLGAALLALIDGCIEQCPASTLQFGFYDDYGNQVSNNFNLTLLNQPLQYQNYLASSTPQTFVFTNWPMTVSNLVAGQWVLSVQGWGKNLVLAVPNDNNTYFFTTLINSNVAYYAKLGSVFMNWTTNLDSWGAIAPGAFLGQLSAVTNIGYTSGQYGITNNVLWLDTNAPSVPAGVLTNTVATNVAGVVQSGGTAFLGFDTLGAGTTAANNLASSLGSAAYYPASYFDLNGSGAAASLASTNALWLDSLGLFLGDAAWNTGTNSIWNNALGLFPTQQQYAQAVTHNQPIIFIVSATNCWATNTYFSFPSTTAMFVWMTNNPLWSMYTNGGRPYGGQILDYGGDLALTNRIAFICPTNYQNSFSIWSPSPMYNSFIFPQSNNWAEGLLFFGEELTNYPSGLALGHFSIRNMGLYAANQSNDVLYVSGPNYAEMVGCFGGVTNNFAVGTDGRTMELGPLPNTPANGWSLTVARFQSHNDNKFVASDDMVNGCEYGIVEDFDHDENSDIQGGSIRGQTGQTNAALILWRGNSEFAAQKIHYVAADYGVIFGQPFFSYNTHPIATFGPHVYRDIQVGGADLTILYANGGSPLVKIDADNVTVTNPANATVAYNSAQGISGSGSYLIGGTGLALQTPDGTMLDNGGQAAFQGPVFIGLVTTNTQQITVYQPVVSGTLPANIIATYTFCYTNAVSPGYAVYTNNLAPSVNVLVNNSFDPNAGASGEASWSITPSNQINNTSASFDYVNGSSALSGNFLDAEGNYTSSLRATNVSYGYPIALSSTNITAGYNNQFYGNGGGLTNLQPASLASPGAPSIASYSPLLSAATLDPAARNNSMTVILTTSSSAQLSYSNYCVISFSSPFPYQPHFVLSPCGTNTEGNASAMWKIGTNTTSTVTISSSSTAPSVNTAFYLNLIGL